MSAAIAAAASMRLFNAVGSPSGRNVGSVRQNSRNTTPPSSAATAGTSNNPPAARDRVPAGAHQ